MRALGHLQLGIPSVLSAAPEWGCSQTKLSVCMSAWRLSAMSLSLTVLSGRAGWWGDDTHPVSLTWAS